MPQTIKWIERFPNVEAAPPELTVWAEQLEISPFMAGLLWQRGLRGKDEMAVFLNPGLRYLDPLSVWPGLEEAARILADGLIAGKKLVVWGDYDVDGITSTALVLDFLEEHGFTASYYIPSRLSEGYGLNIPKLEELAADGWDMLLTVDCGISDIAAVKRARELGFTVVISDHHLPGEKLPEAHAICAPTLDNDVRQNLAGVGVAFLLMAGVNARLVEHGRPRADIRPLTDLVAFGTLADVVSLHGQNRVLVKNGLIYMGSGLRPGIAALKSICKIPPSAEISTRQVVFSLAPRINAAGRMGKSGVAIDLLRSKNRVEAARLAADLDDFNRDRRHEEERIMREAKEHAALQVEQGRMGLVLYAPHWHTGIIGIVASRIVEEWRRPAIILCDSGEKIKGSGRSLENFDLHNALEACSELFLAFGGHRMAAGVSLEPRNLEAFRERFDGIVRAEMGAEPPPPRVKIDGYLGLTDGADFVRLKELEILQPCGVGNPEPVFASNELIVRDVLINKDLTILDVQDPVSGLTLKAKLWRVRRVVPEGMRGRKIRLAYSPRIDRYNGVATVELRVKDWQFL